MVGIFLGSLPSLQAGHGDAWLREPSSFSRWSRTFFSYRRETDSFGEHRLCSSAGAGEVYCVGAPGLAGAEGPCERHYYAGVAGLARAQGPCKLHALRRRSRTRAGSKSMQAARTAQVPQDWHGLRVHAYRTHCAGAPGLARAQSLCKPHTLCRRPRTGAGSGSLRAARTAQAPQSWCGLSGHTSHMHCAGARRPFLAIRALQIKGLCVCCLLGLRAECPFRFNFF